MNHTFGVFHFHYKLNYLHSFSKRLVNLHRRTVENTELPHLRIGSTPSFPRANLLSAGEFSFPVVVQERADFVAYDGFKGFRPVSGVDFDESSLPLEVDVLVKHVMLLLVVLTTPRVVRVDAARTRAPEHHRVLVESSDQLPK